MPEPLIADGSTPIINNSPKYIPSVEDRKLFLGCLAAVLASRYDYQIDIEAAKGAAKTIKVTEAVFNNDNNNTSAMIIQEKSTSVQWSDSKEQIQNERYKKRRHEISTELLLSAGKLLQLDDTDTARGLLPTLDPLLMDRLLEVQKQLDGFDLDDFATEMAIRGANDNDDDGVVVVKAVNSFVRKDVFNSKVKEIRNLQPLMEAMTPGSAVKCLSMLLMEHLLQGGEGYDARVRHCLKTLGMLIFMKESEDYRDEQMPVDVRKFASLKFEALECTIAQKLIELAQSSSKEPSKDAKHSLRAEDSNEGNKGSKFIKGMKIGGAAVAAGVLFAMTAGMAAPAIAAGLAAVPGVAAVASATAVTAYAAAVLTSPVVVAALFGVGGGRLAAYKMKRRVSGLTEFEFLKEERTGGHTEEKRNQTSGQKKIPDGDLFTTVCISGWLHDDKDFQRPWGVTPTQPPITDRSELLQRFYAIHGPEKISNVPKILEIYDCKWTELCCDLTNKYGCDPYHLFPLRNGPKTLVELSRKQRMVLEHLFYELGCGPAPLDSSSESMNPPSPQIHQMYSEKMQPIDYAPIVWPTVPASITAASVAARDQQRVIPIVVQNNTASASGESSDGQNIFESQFIATSVWDYQTRYGGELYTIRWESQLIKEISDSIKKLSYEFVLNQGAKEVLKRTIASGLMIALAVPRLLASATEIIGGTWTVAVERADEAGQILARSLLISNAGNRPVTLVGFSFGARVIYSCLKELAVYQEKWEDYRVGLNTTKIRGAEAPAFQDINVKNSSNPVAQDEDESEEFIKNMREPASVVEDAIILGLPVRIDLNSWKRCRQVVAGRLVNGFSQKDWVLSLMFQYQQIGIKPVSGTCPVNVMGIENVDLTDIVAGHQDYLHKIGVILERIRHCEPFRSDAPSFVTYEVIEDDWT